MEHLYSRLTQRNGSLFLALCITACFVLASGAPPHNPYPAHGLKAGHDPEEDRWVDSIFNAMTPDERLGQLFMIRAHSDKGPDHVAAVEKLIRNYHVGALCFFQGTPQKQVELTNGYQALNTHVPLMIAIDGEWGLGMRLKGTISYPRQLPMGAIQDNWLIYEFGKEVARQCRRIGIHVNFAPVADVNNNAANPVINTRSFGEDRQNVALKSHMYAKGMQDNGVMACAKHFPGHGDTDVDSHYDLPVIRHDRSRLDSIELFPFRALAHQGVGSMMIAHLNVPALDTSLNRPTTLSKYTVTTLLREELGFEGLAFTDALEMKGVTKHFKPGEVEAEALLAGNDMLVLPGNMETAFREIKRYIADGRIAQEDVNKRVKRILRAKYRLGLTSFTPIATDSIDQHLNSPEAIALKWKLYENALTLARNKGNLLPIENTATLDAASLSIGASGKTPFQERLDSYKKMPAYQSPKEISSSERNRLLQALEKKEVVIVSLHGMSSFVKDGYGLSKSALDFIEALNQRTRVVLVVFGTPYSLHHFDAIDPVLVAYEDDRIAQDLAAQALFGAIGISGRLPVTASPLSRFNTGVTTTPVFRMGYAVPERAGMNAEVLDRLDRLAKEAISSGATPGCVVLAAKDGQIVYHKAFGHQAFSKSKAVHTGDIYDLASVTKIAGGTLALMKLYDEGLIDLNAPIGRYLPELAGTNKAGLILKDILAHRAGLQPWLPFYRKTVLKTKTEVNLKPEYYRMAADEQFGIPVANNLFLRSDYPDTIWQEIVNSPLLPTKGYKYSDLGFYMIARMVQRISGKPLDEFLDENFFCPMGLESMGYNPWRRFDVTSVAPTENDAYFRMQKVQSYVHDMGAAMLGGVSGHAGLFSNAADLAAVMQMLLNYGYYGGRRYLNPATVKTFIQRHPGSSRRGMGFDMRQTNERMYQNVSMRMSSEAFGHDGFTGTSAWADPETGAICILLSNRTYPSQKNAKLNGMRMRQRIQSVVFNALHGRPEAEEWAQAKIPPHEGLDDDEMGK